MEHEQWRRGWDKLTDTPYALNGNKVIVYDDTRSLTVKVILLMIFYIMHSKSRWESRSYKHLFLLSAFELFLKI